MAASVHPRVAYTHYKYAPILLKYKIIAEKNASPAYFMALRFQTPELILPENPRF
jgi:hypothetical protein